MPAKRWTKENIVSEFNKFAESGEDISPKNLRDKRNDLLIQIRRKFESYEQFVTNLGYDYEQLLGFKRWSKERVISEATKRRNEGKSMKRNDIERDYPALLSAMCKHFGNFRNAIEACGLNYEECLGLTWWDDEKIKSEFIALYEDDSVKRVEDIRARNRGLDHAIRKYYGGYDNLCEKLKLDVTKIRSEVYEWQANDLLKILKEMKAEGNSLNIASVSSRFPSAVKVAERYFGSYQNALLEVGERYENHVQDHLLSSFAGKEFENLLSDMFSALEKKYDRHYRGLPNIIPDFYNEDKNEIIDAKLSSWSVFNCETIRKYAPNCDKLTIVYLRGEAVEHDYSNMELRHVSYYYKELHEKGLEHFIEQFEQQRKKLEQKIIA